MKMDWRHCGLCAQRVIAPIQSAESAINYGSTDRRLRCLDPLCISPLSWTSIAVGGAISLHGRCHAAISPASFASNRMGLLTVLCLSIGCCNADTYLVRRTRVVQKTNITADPPLLLNTCGRCYTIYLPRIFHHGGAANTDP